MLEQEIVKYEGVEFKQLSLNFKVKMPIEEAMLFAEGLSKINRSIQFWWGDFLNYSEKTYGEDYAQLVPEGIETATLIKWKWVSDRIKPKIRQQDLTYSHHEEVAAIEDEAERESFLKKAVKENLTVRELRKMIKGEPNKKDPARVACPECGIVFDVKDNQYTGK